MHIQDLILLVIGGEAEKSLRGRTTIQKKLYFLSVLNKTDLGFRPHYYGPYSSPVAENLDILVHARFLKEVTESFSTDRNVFGETRRHTYSWTSDSEAVMGEIKKEDGYTDWKRALDTLNNLPLASDFNTLSIAAKVHYIFQQRKRTKRKHIKKFAKEYEWEISKLEIAGVHSFLKALSFISVENSTRPQEK